MLSIKHFYYQPVNDECRHGDNNTMNILLNNYNKLFICFQLDNMFLLLNSYFWWFWSKGIDTLRFPASTISWVTPKVTKCSVHKWTSSSTEQWSPARSAAQGGQELTHLWPGLPSPWSLHNKTLPHADESVSGAGREEQRVYEVVRPLKPKRRRQ